MQTKTNDLATLNSEVKDRYDEMRGYKPKWSYLLIKLNDDATEIVLDSVGDKDLGFDDLVSKLPEHQVRWAVVDFRYTTTTGGKRNKLVMITWVPNVILGPDDAPLSHKESATAKTNAVFNKGVLKRNFSGISCYIEADLPSDLTKAAALEKISRYERDEIDQNSVV